MPWLSMRDGSDVWSRRVEIDWSPLHRLVCDRPEAVVIGLGIFLRVVVYLLNRTMWLDEMSLAVNLVDRPVFDFSEPLTNDQLAPFGFLIVQRALVRVLGDSNFVMRLVPMAAGLAALGLFARVASRILPRRAALVALVLFAFSDDMIYYSSEMKPYSVDLAVGLAISLAALEAVDLGPGRPASPGALAAFAAATAVAPWCSFGSAFIAAGSGVALILAELARARYRVALTLGLIGMAWLANFFASYTLSRRLLSPYTTMYLFWDFAFLPIPPMSPPDLSKAIGILLEVFVNPLNLVIPAWPYLSVILPLALLILGGWSLWGRSRVTFLVVFLPILLALTASALKRYPFHGRLILELVPALFLLIAAGTEWVIRRDASRSRRWSAIVLALLLAYPCLTAISQAMGARFRDFNTHGDLHRNVFIK